MVWWPFATKPERADTSEVTELHSGAPPLYWTVSNGVRVMVQSVAIETGKFARDAKTIRHSNTRFSPDCAGKKRFASGEQP